MPNHQNHTTPSGNPTAAEWLECRDANGKLLFLYSPLRDCISIKKGELTTEVDLVELRQGWLQVLFARLHLL